MFSLLLLLTLLPLTSASVDCRTACRSCREKTEPPSTLQIYCAMCEECKLRRQERLRERVEDYEKAENKALKVAPLLPYDPGYLGYPGYWPPMPPIYPPVPCAGALQQDCPTPPPCASSEEVPAKQTLNLVVETTSTTTTTTTTTNRPSSKPRCRTTPYRKKLRFAPPPMVPVYQSIINLPMPMMPCPFFSDVTRPTTPPSTTVEDIPYSPVYLEGLGNLESNSDKDLANIYIGVPKEIQTS